MLSFILTIFNWGLMIWVRLLHIFIFCFGPYCMFSQSLIDGGTSLPLFIIDTYDNEIPNEPKIEAHLGIIHSTDKTNYITDPFNIYNGRIGIEIRGNGTVNFEKVSYLFETQDENGENNNVSLLDFPKENDWVLYGPLIDRSLLRNVLTYDLAREMGYYASRTQFCEVLINGEYLGVYVFMEKIKRDKNRVDITKFEDEDSSPTDGGYLFKIDSWWNESIGWQSNTYSINDTERKWNYHYLYPKADEISENQKEYIQNAMHQFEQGMQLLKTTGSHEVYDLFDEENFADYFLINELSHNPDAYRLSTYFHKDSEAVDGQIRLGPVWDYNFGFSNYWDRQNEFRGWEYDNDWWEFPHQIPTWWTTLLDDPHFLNLVRERWAYWRDNLISCDAFSEQINDWHLKLEGPAKRNFAKWQILEEPNVFDWSAGNTYQDELDYLNTFICQRILWMDEALDFKDKSIASSPKLENLEIFPNPSDGNINIRSVEGFSIVPHTLKLYTINGVQVFNQVLVPNPDENDLNFNYTGSEAGFYILEVSNSTSSHKSKIIIR